VIESLKVFLHGSELGEPSEVVVFEAEHSSQSPAKGFKHYPSALIGQRWLSFDAYLKMQGEVFLMIRSRY